MRVSLLSLLLALCAVSATARAIFVDNRAQPGGVGTAERPFVNLSDAMRASRELDIIYVVETSQPYRETVTLRRGQMLIGSAYGLDAVRTELHVDFDAPPTPAANGAGPLIEGSVTLTGQNVVAGVSIATASVAALSAASPSGPIQMIATNIQTARGAIGISIGASDFPATFIGGGLTGNGGGGVTMYSGRGEVIFDRFTLDGTFTTAIDIRGRSGAVSFRGRGAIDVADATQPAATIADCTGRVTIEVPLRITAHSRGLFISRSTVKISGDNSRLEATNAPALEIRDAVVDAAFAGVSANGGDRGVIVDKMRGTLAISGGTIANVRLHGVEITQSAGVRLKGITLTDSGSGDRSKCDDQLEAGTNVRCGAALYLRHVAHSEIENVVVTGGTQVGLNANNIEDMTFAGLQIRGVGDETGEAAVVIDEAKGAVKFARCVFEDAAGGGVVIAQQFNGAKVVFDRCTFSAATRPVLAPHLASFRTSGGGRLDVEIRNSDLHDNAGGALRAEAAGASSLRISVVDTHAQRFGRTAIETTAKEQAKVTLVLERADVMTPAVVDRPAVTVAASDTSSACLSVTQSRVYIGAAEAPIRVTAAPGARVSVARGGGEGPAIDAPPGAAAVSACP